MCGCVDVCACVCVCVCTYLEVTKFSGGGSDVLEHGA